MNYYRELNSLCVYCRQQIEDGEKNGSEDDDEEKPGKRVMGPRKKFIWDDKLRFGLLQDKIINNEAEQTLTPLIG